MKDLRIPILIIIFIFFPFSCSTDPTSAKPEQNTPPNASFIVTPDSGNTTTMFNFDASNSTDKEDSSSLLKVRWDLDNDGIWDIDFSTQKKITHQYSIEGEKTIKLEVRDTQGLSDSVFHQIHISKYDSLAYPGIAISLPLGLHEVYYMRLINENYMTYRGWKDGSGGGIIHPYYFNIHTGEYIWKNVSDYKNSIFVSEVTINNKENVKIEYPNNTIITFPGNYPSFNNSGSLIVFQNADTIFTYNLETLKRKEIYIGGTYPELDNNTIFFLKRYTEALFDIYSIDTSGTNLIKISKSSENYEYPRASNSYLKINKKLDDWESDLQIINENGEIVFYKTVPGSDIDIFNEFIIYVRPHHEGYREKEIYMFKWR